MNRLGINYSNLDGGTFPSFLDWCARAQPAVTVVMDDQGKAEQVLDAVPDGIVILRLTSVTINGEQIAEQNLWKDVSPEAYVQWVQRNHHNRALWVYVSNEPAPTENDVSRDADCADWHAAVLDRLCAAGYRVCLANYGSGVIDPARVAAGDYDHLIERLLHWCAAGVAMLGIHEYTVGAIPTAINPTYTPDYRQEHAILDDNAVQPGNWLLREEIEALIQRMTLDSYNHFWHINRIPVMFRLRCEQLGWDWLTLRYAVTEGSIDRMGDLAGFERRIDAYGRYGTVYELAAGRVSPADSHRRYPAYRGQNTWIQFFAQQYLQRGWSGERAFYEMMAWLDRAVYDETVVGITLFQWSYLGAYKQNPDSEDWGGVGFNVHFLPEYLELAAKHTAYDPLATDEMPVTAAPDENTTWETVTVAGATARIRHQPAGVVIGAARPGEQIALGTMPQIEAALDGTTYRWQPVRWLDTHNTEKVGWVATDSGVTFEPLTDDELGGDPKLAAQVTRLATTLDAVQAQTNANVRGVDELRRALENLQMDMASARPALGLDLDGVKVLAGTLRQAADVLTNRVREIEAQHEATV